MSSCPHCRGTGQVEAVDRLAILRLRCNEQGLWVSPDDRCHERDAAKLLGRSIDTLRRWRTEDPGLPVFRTRGRVTWSLEWIAEQIAQGDAT